MKLLHMGTTDVKPMDYENNDTIIANSPKKPKGLWAAQLINGKSDWIDFVKNELIESGISTESAIIDGSVLKIISQSQIL